jgi:hypothetical protein
MRCREGANGLDEEAERNSGSVRRSCFVRVVSPVFAIVLEALTASLIPFYVQNAAFSNSFVVVLFCGVCTISV